MNRSEPDKAEWLDQNGKYDPELHFKALRGYPTGERPDDKRVRTRNRKPPNLIIQESYSGEQINWTQLTNGIYQTGEPPIYGAIKMLRGRHLHKAIHSALENEMKKDKKDRKLIIARSAGVKKYRSSSQLTYFEDTPRLSFDFDKPVDDAGKCVASFLSTFPEMTGYLKEVEVVWPIKSDRREAVGTLYSRADGVAINSSAGGSKVIGVGEFKTTDSEKFDSDRLLMELSRLMWQWEVMNQEQLRTIAGWKKHFRSRIPLNLLTVNVPDYPVVALITPKQLHTNTSAGLTDEHVAYYKKIVHEELLLKLRK